MMALALEPGKALTLRLGKGSTLLVSHPGPTDIACEAGSLWLTERHQTTDWVLGAGQAQRFACARALVISSAGDATLRVLAAAPVPAPGRRGPVFGAFSKRAPC